MATDPSLGGAARPDRGGTTGGDATRGDRSGRDAGGGPAIVGETRQSRPIRDSGGRDCVGAGAGELGTPLAPRRIRRPGLALDLFEHVWEPEEASALFQALRTQIAWEQHAVRLFGRHVPCPRLSAWHGEPGARYVYSGIALVAAGWQQDVLAVLRRVERVVGATFDSVLVQLYRDGSDSMGWHSDDEPALGPRPLIASVSLGASRRFVLRHRTRRDVERVELWLDDASLLVMRGDTQHAWHHALPKTRRPVGPRINLTFRRLLSAVPRAHAPAGDVVSQA